MTVKDSQQFNSKDMMVSIRQLFILILLVFGIQSLAKSEEFDPGFPAQGGANGTVFATALQSDGKIVIAGRFTKVNGIARQLVARIDADGSLDNSFQSPMPSAPFVIYSAAIQPDGKILIGGSFTRSGNTLENYILRLNQDGSPDIGFVPGAGANMTVKAIALQADGKILIGGLFTEFDKKPVNRIARLNSNGSLDQSFAGGTGANAAVETIAVDNDGKILLGGSFTSINNTSRSGIARLNENGSLDTSFDIGSGAAGASAGGGNNTVHSIAIQTDGKILLGGDFNYFNGIERRKILRLNSDGSLDAAFNIGTNIDGGVREINILPDGQILLGGTFHLFSPLSRQRIARLNADGSVDESFNPSSVTGEIFSLTTQPDGKIVIGGEFNGVQFSLRYKIARLNADGSLDLPFAPAGGADQEIYKIVRLSDNKFLIGGSFRRFNGIPREGIVRLNTDGSVDYSFDSSNGINEGNYSKINSIIPLEDGKILIGGDFESYSNITRRGIARLNEDGSLDTSFTASLNVGYTNKLVRQPDGKILVGGNFDGVNGNNQPNLARLNADGTIDSSFLMGAGPNSYLYSTELQPDGKILIAGDFYRYNNVNRESIARLNSDGSLDQTFNAGEFTGTAYGTLLQPDGKILVRGFFDRINGVSRARFARLNSDGSIDLSFEPGAGPYGIILDFVLQPNGKIIIGGTFSEYNNVSQSRLTRINPDGSLDATLISGFGPNNNVRALWLDSDRSLLIGGSFNAYSGISTTNLIRLKALNRPLYDFDGDGKSDISVFRPSTGSWYLLQSSNNSFLGQSFGIESDVITPADYDGDGKTDIAVFRPEMGTWYLQQSTIGFTAIRFGQNGDIPVPADYDGDGKADITVFRPSTGGWYRLNSLNGQFAGVLFGASEDKPTIGDFDGDGKADITVYRPSTGSWYRLNSTNNQFVAVQFGVAEDKPVPADFDGDGKTDIAVYRPSTGSWYRLNSSNGEFAAVGFGISEDRPVPGDYDGDGKADIAVFRPSDGNWYLLHSTSGFAAVRFGIGEDKPIPNAFIK